MRPLSTKLASTLPHVVFFTHVLLQLSHLVTDFLKNLYVQDLRFLLIIFGLVLYFWSSTVELFEECPDIHVYDFVVLTFFQI